MNAVLNYSPGMHKMRKRLMIKKRLVGNTSMAMSFDFQNTNHCLLQPLVLAPSCLPCKQFILICLNFLLLFESQLISSTIIFIFQHSFYIYVGSGWCVLSIQPRSSVYRSGGHIRTHVWDCRIYSILILLPT